MTDEKRSLVDTTEAELVAVLEKRWRTPFTGVPNSEATVVLTEILRRAIEEQRKANRLQFWLNLVFGIATVIGAVATARSFFK